MSLETCNGTDQVRTDRDVAVSACQQCNLLTEEIGAAIDRIEVLIAERDMARARNSELASMLIVEKRRADKAEELVRGLNTIMLEMRKEVSA